MNPTARKSIDKIFQVKRFIDKLVFLATEKIKKRFPIYTRLKAISRPHTENKNYKLTIMKGKF